MSRKKTRVRSSLSRLLRSKKSLGTSSGVDKPLIILVGVVLFFGLILRASATSILSFTETGSSYSYVRQQMLHGILPGIILFLVAMHVDYHKYRRFAPLLMLQPDIGTMLIFIGVGMILFVVANGNMLHAIVAMTMGALIALPRVIGANYRIERLLTFWDPG